MDEMEKRAMTWLSSRGSPESYLRRTSEFNRDPVVDA
jgi:hypothetical protein